MTRAKAGSVAQCAIACAAAFATGLTLRSAPWTAALYAASAILSTFAAAILWERAKR